MRPDIGLPEIPWLQEIRPHQAKVLDEIDRAFKDGARVVAVDAPTGSGKSLVAELTRRRLFAKGLYVCSDRKLQDQFIDQFPYAALLKGRANYPTLDHPTITTDLCNATKTSGCTLCEPNNACPYRVAKRRALKADLACINLAYFLAEANHVGGFSGVDLLIVDEADLLDGQLIAFAELSIKQSVLNRLSVRPPRDGAPETMLLWLRGLRARVEQALRELNRNVSAPAALKWHQTLTKLLTKTERASDGITRGTWITVLGEHAISVKPIQPSEVGPQALWPHAERFLLMSATLLDGQQFVETLGCPYPAVALSVASPFPPQNRPIYFRPAANMAKQYKETAWPAVAAETAKLIAAYPNERVLVHTVSHTFTGYLAEFLQATIKDRPLFIQVGEPTTETYNAEMLAAYQDTPGAVLLSPSLVRGVDLPDDLCRIQIVVKLPWASRGDPQVEARRTAPRGRCWYTTHMIRGLIQSTGRGVRHERDVCLTFILDGGFQKIWDWSWKLLPAYWRQAIRMPKAPLHLSPFPPLASPYAMLGRAG